MTASTAPKSRFKYAATILGAFAILALAPATAHAADDNPTTGGGGCTYTDKDGYPIPIDDGQSVIVDGKTVSCSGGTITTTPKKNVGNVRVPVIKGGTLSVFAQP
ncbi:hypothetical protein [Mycolicibacterium stellerae]|uniref:hypothetical protein n=1 Tax=Mycolicibacterium stellerae TaxID=2358193 RepID=UPI000F0BCB7F|nr:hypothetical protein [Mycolicibacterium stellerae]